MRSRVAIPTTLTLLALLASGGCGGGDSGPPVGQTVAIKGKITYMGQPLSQGTIQFEPEDSGREANGNIQPDGTFSLTTFREGDGAIPGTHRVAVSGTGDGGKVVVPIQFHNPSSSKVEIEVSAGKTEYAIDLK